MCHIFLRRDGASDNVNYTVFYFLIFLLRFREELGIPELTRIETNRLPVGHTHLDIDQLFSIWSQYIFGSGRRRTQPKEMPTIEHMMVEFKKCHGNMLDSVDRLALTVRGKLLLLSCVAHQLSLPSLLFSV
jgi:hypothetical protein